MLMCLDFIIKGREGRRGGEFKSRLRSYIQKYKSFIKKKKKQSSKVLIKIPKFSGKFLPFYSPVGPISTKICIHYQWTHQKSKNTKINQGGQNLEIIAPFGPNSSNIQDSCQIQFQFSGFTSRIAPILRLKKYKNVLFSALQKCVFFFSFLNQYLLNF